MEKKLNFTSHLWFLWLILTSLYLFPTFFIGNSISIFGSVIGLFVPAGSSATLYAMISLFSSDMFLGGPLSTPALFAIVGLILFFFFFEKFFDKSSISKYFTTYSKRILFNLILLFLITLVLDLLFYQEWKSANFLFNSANPECVKIQHEMVTAQNESFSMTDKYTALSNKFNSDLRSGKVTIDQRDAILGPLDKERRRLEEQVMQPLFEKRKEICKSEI